MDTPDIIILPTWGYKADGSARVFSLAPGESLPDGWSTSPSVILDPALATAQALTDRAAGRPYAESLDVPVAVAPDAAASEIERLKAIIDAGMKENEDLVAEVTKAEELLEAAAAEVATLKAALDKALSDGADATAARDEAVAAADRLSAELADAHKALDAATAPKAPAKAR